MPSNREIFLRLLIANKMKQQEGQQQFRREALRAIFQEAAKQNPGAALRYLQRPTPDNFNALLTVPGQANVPQNAPVTSYSTDKHGRIIGAQHKVPTPPYRIGTSQTERRFITSGTEGDIGQGIVPKGASIPFLLSKGAQKAGFKTSISGKGVPSFTPMASKDIEENEFQSYLQRGVNAASRASYENKIKIYQRIVQKYPKRRAEVLGAILPK